MRTLAGRKILLGPSSFAAGDKSPLRVLEEAGLIIIDNPHKRKLTKPELMELAAGGVTGLIAGLETLDREVMEKTAIKVISRCGSGMSNVDQQAAKELGISVYSTPDAPTTAVAEITIGALLALLRRIAPLNAKMHMRIWEKHTGFELAGKTVCIVGLGRIGRRVAKIVAAFDAAVIAVDPYLAAAPDDVSLVTMDEALARADIISLHASGEHCIIGGAELDRMKKGVYILNAGRGGLVDETALAEHLRAGKVAGAWIDTFAEEPYSGELCGLPQAILTPHIGSYSYEGRLKMEMQASENLLEGLRLL